MSIRTDRHPFVVKKLLWEAVLVLTFLPHLLIPQNLLDLYEDVLPSTLLNDPLTRSQLSQLLEARVKIHPDLLYLYLSFHADSSAWNSRRSDRTQLRRYITAIEVVYACMRADWADRVIISVMSSGHHQEAQQELQSILAPLLTCPPTDSPLDLPPAELDTNRRNYILSVFYTWTLPDSYDPSEDYSVARNEAENQYKSDLLARALRSPNLNSIRDILDSWHLFDPQARLAYGSSAEVTLGEFLLRVLISSRSTAQLPNFQIGAGMSFAHSVFMVDGSLPINSGPDFHIRKPMPTRNATLSMSYRIVTDEYFGFLSYIKLSFDFNLGVSFRSYPQLAGGFSRQSKILSVENGVIRTDYYDERFALHRGIVATMPASLISCRISTPLLVASEGSMFEIGLQALWGSAEYTVDYDYSYSKTHTWRRDNATIDSTETLADLSENRSVVLKVQRNIFSPTLGFSFRLGSMLSCHMLVSFHNQSLFLNLGL